MIWALTKLFYFDLQSVVILERDFRFCGKRRETLSRKKRKGKERKRKERERERIKFSRVLECEVAQWNRKKKVKNAQIITVDI